MYSESCRTIAAMLNGYISSCSPEQVQELKQLLIDTISDIDNDNLTQEKSTDSTAENEHTEPKKQRAPKVPIDKNLAQRLYEMAKVHPDYDYPDLEKILKLNPKTIKDNKKLIYFKNEYRRLRDIVKLGRLMNNKNLRRYEIEEGYNDDE